MIIKEIKEYIKKCLSDTDYYDEDLEVTTSNRPELCDYQCNNAFKIAHTLKLSPMDIANSICEVIKQSEKFSDYFSEINACAPGFINIIISDKFIVANLNKQIASENFGLKTENESDLYFIDYGGPNIAKPLHVGHLRSAIVGESIKRILRFSGVKTMCDVHFGDYGLQMGQVIYGMQEEGKTPENVTLEDLERIYPKISGLCKENEEVKEKCAEITKKLQDGDKEYRVYFERILDLSRADIIRIYNYLDVSFDMYKGESDAYEYLPKIFDKYTHEGKIIQSQGAYVIVIDENPEVPPVVFRKSNGAYLYASTDIGSIYERVNYKPKSIIYVADIRQENHFNSLFKACDVLGIAPNIDFEFCGFGTVNGKDGKPFKTRAGSAPKLDSLLAQVKEALISEKESNADMSEEDMDILVNATIKFADLQNHRAKDYIFDIEKFAKVVGKTGPYILYTYTRINKLLKDLNMSQKELSNKVYNACDRDLRIYLLKLENYFEKALSMRLPSYICDYLFNLCNFANTFYENNRLLSETDIEKKQDFVSLLMHTKNIIKCLLDLIVIKTPSKM